MVDVNFSKLDNIIVSPFVGWGERFVVVLPYRTATGQYREWVQSSWDTEQDAVFEANDWRRIYREAMVFLTQDYLQILKRREKENEERKTTKKKIKEVAKEGQPDLFSDEW